MIALQATSDGDSSQANAPTSLEPLARDKFFAPRLPFTLVSYEIFIGIDANARLDALEMGASDANAAKPAASQSRRFLDKSLLVALYDSTKFRHATADT